MSTIPQLPTLKTRLHNLNMQKARYGISADPHISMEASDLETMISQMELIDIHRRNLDTLLKQRNVQGTDARPSIINQILSERAEVVRLRQVCARLGQSVPSHPVDDDEPTIEPPSIERPAPRPPLMSGSDLKAKLDQIQRILDEIRATL